MGSQAASRQLSIFTNSSLLTGKHFDSKSQLGNYILQF